MIHFINIKEENIPGAKFAFLDTITNKFITLLDVQYWECWMEFEHDFQCDISNTFKDIERFKKLCPEWVFEKE